MYDASLASFLSFPDLLKATPVAEGDLRFIYLEASNESTDLQREVVMGKALSDSADYFLRFGNIDIDHYTQIGAKAGIKDYLRYEIGRPIEVRSSSPSTWVKAQLYTGDNPMAARANDVWNSLQLNPPARWYPSVGGGILEKAQQRDPATGMMHTVVKKVRWTNIGLSRTPVNDTVSTVTTVPIGMLTKSWTSDGLDLTKALDSGGYETDSAKLSGGGALRRQSLDRKLQNYWDFRDGLATDIKAKMVKGDMASIVDRAQQHYGLDAATAAEWADKFHSGLRRDLSAALSPATVRN